MLKSSIQCLIEITAEIGAIPRYIYGTSPNVVSLSKSNSLLRRVFYQCYLYIALKLSRLKYLFFGYMDMFFFCICFVNMV